MAGPTSSFLLPPFPPNGPRRRLLRAPGLGIPSPNTRFLPDLRVHTKAPSSGLRDALSLALLRLPRPVLLSIPAQPSGSDPRPRPRRLSGQPPVPAGSFSSAPRPRGSHWTPCPPPLGHTEARPFPLLPPPTPVLSQPLRPQVSPSRRPRPHLPSNCWFLPPSLLSDVSRETRVQALRARESPPRLLPPWRQGRWDT